MYNIWKGQYSVMYHSITRRIKCGQLSNLASNKLYTQVNENSMKTVTPFTVFASLFYTTCVNVRYICSLNIRYI